MPGATKSLFRVDGSYNSAMPLNVIKARLNALRKNPPTGEVEKSVVDDFNAMVDQLEEELQDPETAERSLAVDPAEDRESYGRGELSLVAEFPDRGRVLLSGIAEDGGGR
jgi:hypothetical protein